MKSREEQLTWAKQRALICVDWVTSPTLCVNYAVADAVAGSPRNAIAAHAEGLILSLVENLERKLRAF
jgi:hypothetical protein